MARIDDMPSFLSAELTSSNTRGCSFYFTRLSVDEEGFYSALPEVLANEIRDGIHNVPEARAVIEAYRDIANVDLLTLLNSPRLDVSDIQLHKLYQTGLHAVLAFYLRYRLDVQVDAVGFYSGGATPAFLFAGAYTAADYIRSIFPFNKLVRERMAIEGQARNLAQVLLIGEPDNDIGRFVSARLRESRDLSELYVKDRRQSHALLVAGPPGQLTRLVEQTEARFPSVVSKRSPVLRHRFASHSPYLDADALSADLDERFFLPPNTTIVGTCGEILSSGRDARLTAKKIFADGVIGPMDTGRAVEAMARHNKRILVIGGFHAAKVLASLEITAGLSIDLAPEFAVEADSRVVGKQIYDGRVTESAAG
jgi:hypothetical protein